jgi:hypothetical protein
MSWFKSPWLCKFFGHRFALINDLRDGLIKRQRIVYRCLRCGDPMIVREGERRGEDRRQVERRGSHRGTNDRRGGERRRFYPSQPHLAHS